MPCLFNVPAAGRKEKERGRGEEQDHILFFSGV